MTTITKNFKTVAATLALGIIASPALAHPGHIEAASDGHSHLLALGAVSVALLVGGFGLLHNIRSARAKADKS